MKLRRVAASLVVAAALLAVLLAAATIWLLLTDPITVATSLQDGNVTPLVQAFVRAVADALRGLLAWL